MNGNPLRRQARRLLEQVLPEGSTARDLVRFSRLCVRDGREYNERIREHWREWGVEVGPSRSYLLWTVGHKPSRRNLAKQRVAARKTVHPLGVHLVIDATGGSHGVESTLRSLQAQTWGHWSAAVVGAEPATAFTDPRVTRDPARLDIGEAAAAVASTVPRHDLIIFLDAGDRLEPDALFEVTAAAWQDPAVSLVYWDDDRIDGLGLRSDPRFRPSWSPEMLLGANYIGKSFALRAGTLLDTGALRTDLESAVWWDLLLRCALDRDRIARVPRVLQHCSRPRPEPTPSASVEVVNEHLRRQALPATAAWEAGVVRIRWEHDHTPHVTVIIPTRHNRAMLDQCLPSLERTEYPSFDVVVVDNGGRTDEREQWYRSAFPGLDLQVEWWDREFNYSAVNNSAARGARGEVLVFLNDDTELPDPGWLSEIVGWTTRPEIGVVGLQLVDGSGSIQHGGVILGLNGFADHLFEGMAPGSPSLLGPTTWYRNVLSVTAACLGIRRELFDDLGGFDERFELCGSDVVLGLDSVLAGKRNICSPFGGVRHLESATRGTNVPAADFFASYWRYQRWIYAGDPYFSPSLSLESRRPALKSTVERKPGERFSGPLGRTFTVFKMTSDKAEAERLAGIFRVTDADQESVNALHAANAKPFAPKTINWFLPDVDSPFYGGYNTALRIADHLARIHGVENRFVVWSDENEPYFRSALAAAFPALTDSPIVFHDGTREDIARVPECDVAVASLWATAYSVAQFQGARRKAYLIQDFEPMFYPAGTLYALAEESYRLGLYGLCNTEYMLRIYEDRYSGKGMSFMPAVDTRVFHAEGRDLDAPLDRPTTVFVYARPGHWRNCWELAEIALVELKDRLGDRVRIVTAGSWTQHNKLPNGIKHLGLLDYKETGDLYRRCDVGVALTVSEHPSYLPIELLACGVPVVAFDNPAGYWLLKDHSNSLLVRRTVDGLRDGIEEMVTDDELRRRLAKQGLRDIAEGHASWEKALSGIYGYLSDPEGGASTS